MEIEKMGPLVSIIVPVYNMEIYLEQCLNSIIRQTYKNLQIILVNDGSIDGSLAICEAYATKDKRIEIINKENGGLSSARNRGIENAKGEYLCFLDSDDYVLNNHIENLICSILKYNTDIAVCGYYEVFDNNKLITHRYKKRGIIKKEELFQSILKTEDIGNYAWNKIYKKKLFESAKFPIGKAYEDIYITYKLFGMSSTVCIIDIPTYYYRQRKNSISKATRLDYMKDQWEAINERNSYIKYYYPNLTSDCDKNTLKFLIVIFNQISKQYMGIDELNEYRKKIYEYSKNAECDQKKYRLMMQMILKIPHLYSCIIYSYSSLKKLLRGGN